MTCFDRRFGQVYKETIEDYCLLRDLLERWRPSGAAIGDDGLRLAIRNGYLNFYRLGQSVAKLSLDKEGEPHAEVHHKYLRDGATGQKYEKLESKKYDSANGVPKWIERCERYASEEKRFVDEVVGRNPDVIDLEMALPAMDLDGDRKVAPRIDLVALEPSGNGWRIVFWEAKLSADARVRRRDDTPPEVVSQLKTYEDWLSKQGETVAKAYRDNGRLLRDLHDAARQAGLVLPPLSPATSAIADQTVALAVDPKPRLLIADLPREDPKYSDSFAANGHETKLRKALGSRLHVVRDESGFALPASR